MALFDRFRQPKWKHADPAIRLEAVNELGDDAQEVLCSLAREDADPGVRRRAVARVEDIGTLASVARSDMDEGVRAEARKLLMDLATDGSDESEALEALAGLDDERDLAVIARTTDAEAVGLAALRRVSAPRLIGSVAGRAAGGGIRLAALALMTDPAERLLVALNSEHKDVALSALESLTDADALEQIANRAKNKLVSRRARTRLRDQQPAAVDAPAHTGELNRDRLCDMVEGLGHEPRVDAIQAPLDAAVEAWQQLAALDEAPSLLQTRFDAAAAAARARLEQLRADVAAVQAEAEARAAKDARRADVCQQLEDYAGDDIEDAVTAAQTAWGELDAEHEPGSDAVNQRFLASIARQRARLAARLADAERHTQLASLAGEAELLAGMDDLPHAHKRWADLLRRWTSLAQDGSNVDPVLVSRVKAAESAIASRTAAIREQEGAARGENLARALASCDRLEAITARENLPLKDAEQALRDARSTAEQLGALPSRDDQGAIVDRLKKVQARLMDVIRDLRSADDWKRWANATVQQELCEKIEALAQIEALPDVAKRLKDLRQDWKQASAGPRGAEGDALWQRFKAGADTAQTRVDAFYAQRSVEDAAVLQEKAQLAEQAEALAESTDWLKTADALKALQQRWNALGHAPRGEQGKALNNRFRAACDRFFTRRKDDLTQRKDVWSANQAVKEDLIAQAEVIAETTDWNAGVETIKALQAAWKASGPVKRQKSEQLWQKFRAACDRFFERYKHRHEAEFDTRRATREQALIDFEALAAEEGTEGPPVLARAEAAWHTWRNGPPLPRDIVRPMQDRFATASQALLERYPETFRRSAFDPEVTRTRMTELVTQVEQLGSPLSSPQASVQVAPAAALATMLKEALASNTIGGRVDDQTKRRAAQETVRVARAAWSRLGPASGDDAADLERRFAAACRKFDDPRDQHGDRGDRGDRRGPRPQGARARAPRQDQRA
ncbi:hypothetical protein LuPra_03561 [Luteitalea pratensis]|uniref:DUF349 domain-containing protein n=1 Tax=Luteitalea pratensis TaxID=1855912 RepID=A0A143PPI1_LUTPR|nr:DUF349 domain-containing protein [Luteitalea pratensis]AMY10331.1 hypothetical protein LuPra_03561 [Luteitalea pratensis]